MKKNLSQLMQGLTQTESLPPLQVSGLAYDSRQVRPGDLFAALGGQEHDGHDYIPQAIAQGAVAVVGAQALTGLSVPYVQVESPRRVLAAMASRFYDEPTRHMPVIGITGTNGKTTCTYLIESILRAAGFAPAVIGTIEYRFGNQTIPASHTTPESLDLQRWIAQARELGANALVMEVSSHGLDQDRIRECHFDAVLFTNLSQDHLDYHGTMENYFAAKTRLFTEVLPQSTKKTKHAYINWDDPYGRRLGELVPALRCGHDPELEYSVEREAYTWDGMSATIKTPQGPLEIHSPLIGPFNLNNILLALAACQGLGIGMEDLATGIRQMKGVPGRLESVPHTGDFKVVIDYAHTPDALEHVLKCLRTLNPRRLITVFGCGGDRDPGKRPLMGKAVAGGSDLVIVTSDNPRTEAPERIIEQIIPGLESSDLSPYSPASRTGYLVIEDRRQAIERSLQEVDTGDILLIAGKGHENYQIIGKEKRHFDDKEEVLRVLGELP